LRCSDSAKDKQKAAESRAKQSGSQHAEPHDGKSPWEKACGDYATRNRKNKHHLTRAIRNDLASLLLLQARNTMSTIRAADFNSIAQLVEETILRTFILAALSVAFLAASAYLSAGLDKESVNVRLYLVDARTGKGIAGIVRVFPAGQGKPLALPGLFDRLRGLEKSATVVGWYVVPAGGAETTLPRIDLRLEAVSGLETALVRQNVDLRTDLAGKLTIKLPFLFSPKQHGLVAGNTHLHLRGLSREESDQYLRQIPAADGLKVMFISYLERFHDDQHYTTNHYPIGFLKQVRPTAVLSLFGDATRHANRPPA